MSIVERAPAVESQHSRRRPIVSVIVPVHNGSSRLTHLLGAFADQTAPPDSFEILFVDDCSSDGTPDLILAAGGARVIRAGVRGGAYAARNLALSEARGQFYAFTDSDCLPARDWIERGIASLEASGADLLAGRIDVDVGRNPSVAALVDAWRFLDQRRWASQGVGATANLWVRRELFDVLGPFQGRLLSGGDAEFCHRAGAAGRQLVYAHDVVVAHPPRSQLRALARKAFRQGYGAAGQIRHADGPMGGRGRLWLQVGRYIPRDRVKDIQRLTDQGYHPSRLERVGMFWVCYFALKLPSLAGNLVGDVVEAFRRD